METDAIASLSRGRTKSHSHSHDLSLNARNALSSSHATADDLLVVHVFVQVKEGCEDAFKAASVKNATNSVQEAGVARFDVVQELEDKTKVVQFRANAPAPKSYPLPSSL